MQLTFAAGGPATLNGSLSRTPKARGRTARQCVPHPSAAPVPRLRAAPDGRTLPRVPIGENIPRVRNLRASTRDGAGGAGRNEDSEEGNGEPEGDQSIGGGAVIGRVARRTLLVSFRCDVCGERSERAVNPDAWRRGTVFAQCGACETWHQMKDNLGLIEEIRYAEEGEEGGTPAEGAGEE